MPFIYAPGDPAANSFLSIEEGDEFAASMLGGEAWSTADVSRKQAAAVTATSILSTRLCYNGSAVTSTQALPFPRLYLNNRNGYPLASDVVPYDMKLAGWFLAVRLLKSSDVSEILSEVESSVQGLTKLVAGPVELGFDKDVRFREVPTDVLMLIPSAWICVVDTSPKFMFVSM